MLKLQYEKDKNKSQFSYALNSWLQQGWRGWIDDKYEREN